MSFMGLTVILVFSGAFQVLFLGASGVLRRFQGVRRGGSRGIPGGLMGVSGRCSKIWSTWFMSTLILDYYTPKPPFG